MSDVAHDPVELLQRLIRFDTTNPPGNERDCVLWAKTLCDAVGLDTRIVAKDDARPNLLARSEPVKPDETLRVRI